MPLKQYVMMVNQINSAVSGDLHLGVPELSTRLSPPCPAGRGHGATGWNRASGHRFDDRLRRRMCDEGDTGGESAVAGNVVGVVGANHHVFDRLRRQPGDPLDEPFRLRHVPLPIGDDNAVRRNDDEAVGREGEVAAQVSVQILIGVHVVGQRDDARKVALAEPANRRIQPS